MLLSKVLSTLVNEIILYIICRICFSKTLYQGIEVILIHFIFQTNLIYQWNVKFLASIGLYIYKTNTPSGWYLQCMNDICCSSLLIFFLNRSCDNLILLSLRCYSLHLWMQLFCSSYAGFAVLSSCIKE